MTPSPVNWVGETNLVYTNLLHTLQGWKSELNFVLKYVYNYIKHIYRHTTG